MAKKISIIGVVALVILLGLALAAHHAVRSFFYPKAPPPPPIVTASAEELLKQFESVLRKQRAPLLETLQPGIRPDQITVLETAGHFRLSDDLKALYRWHNGVSSNSTAEFIPGHSFESLIQIVLGRDLEKQQLQSATGLQRAVFAIFAGHRKDWITILPDGAGDGYFFDPNRKDEEGAFF